MRMDWGFDRTLAVSPVGIVGCSAWSGCVVSGTQGFMKRFEQFFSGQGLKDLKSLGKSRGGDEEALLPRLLCW